MQVVRGRSHERSFALRRRKMCRPLRNQTETRFVSCSCHQFGLASAWRFVPPPPGRHAPHRSSEGDDRRSQRSADAAEG